MVLAIHKLISQKYIYIYYKLQLSVFMIAGSHCRFLLFLAQSRPCADSLLWTSQHIQRLQWSLSGPECFRDYIVSIRVSLGYRFWHAVGPGKKGKIGIKQHPIFQMAARTMKYQIAFQALHANTSELYDYTSRYRKASLLVANHTAFHGLEPLSRQKSASHI